MRTWSKFQEDIFAEVAEGEGHLVVLARAGSGKTTVIVESFNHVPQGKSVLMVAFNKSIATELGSRAPEGVTVQTLHSFGFRALKRAYGSDLDETKARRLLGDRLEGIDLKKNPELKDLHRTIPKLLSLAKGCLSKSTDELEALCDDHDIESECDQRILVQHCMGVMEKSMDEVKKIDFDDMVWLPVVKDIGVKKFDVVFIDETQDLNSCQIELALKACAPGGRIIAVGDDRQSIYGFRGADKNAVPRLVKRLNAKVLPLSVTYRCAKSIVAQVKRIVPDLEPAPGAQEGKVEPLSYGKMFDLVQPNDFILSRTNAPLIGLCLSFLKEGRRAKIEGRDIGASLVALVKRAKADSVLELVTWIHKWSDDECKKILARDEEADTGHIQDKAACIVALTDGADSVEEVLKRANDLFSDSSGHGKIILSTTHKAKGLERDRVFLLAWTYGRIRKDARPSQVTEEKNLYYVACTRAREHLYLVSKREEEVET